jgi:hypothetical protein
MNGSNGRDRYFTESQIEKWLSDFKIAPETSQVFSVELERMAENWTNHCKSEFPQTPAKERREQLDRLYRHSAALEAALRSLSPRGWSELEHTTDVLKTSDLDEGIDLVWVPWTDTRVPHFHLGPTSESCADSISLDTLLATLGMIQRAASFPDLTFDGVKTGPEPDRSLEIGIRHLHKFWESTLGREFKRGVSQDGEPTSQAAWFCVEVYGAISPNTPKSRVLDMMKKRITWYRKIKAGKV